MFTNLSIDQLAHVTGGCGGVPAAQPEQPEGGAQAAAAGPAPEGKPQGAGGDRIGRVLASLPDIIGNVRQIVRSVRGMRSAGAGAKPNASAQV